MAAAANAGRCPACGSPRLIAHAELDDLAIAHIDCDAFYASVEKRDDPSLKDKPVIVGGGRRGVVSAACYIARLYGVRSAMPMFKALAACPNAVVVTPDMAKYSRVGGEIREMMRSLTPLVEPLSIDEAFLDLAGTSELHHGSPARSLARLALEVERRIGVTVSIGLSYNKSLAKIASDLDKPRGFAMIGRGEAVDFLGPKPVGLIWGVGKALQARLAGDGIATIADLRGAQEIELVARYGSIGRRLYRFARGEDDRRVDPDGEMKSISAETTFDEDIASEALLAGELWPLCEKVSRRMKRYGLLGRSIQLKLKTSDFKTLTRSRRLPAATQLGEALYQAALPLLKAECTGRRYRLIGVGAADLAPESEAAQPDLLSGGDQRQVDVERVMDALRARLGEDAIRKGRGLAPARAPAARALAARRREPLQLLQNRVDREAAVVQGQPVDDAIGIDADALLLLRRRLIPCRRLALGREEGEAEAIDGTGRQQRRELRLLGGGLAAAGERSADLHRPLVVGAVEDGGEKRRVARRQMAEQGEAMGRSGNRVPRGKVSCFCAGRLEADQPGLAGRRHLGFALVLRGDVVAVEIAHEEAVALAVLRFPGIQIPADLIRPSVVIEEFEAGLLRRRPAVAGIGELIGHDALDVDDVAPRQVVAEGEEISGAVRQELAGPRHGGGRSRDGEKGGRQHPRCQEQPCQMFHAPLGSAGLSRSGLPCPSGPR